MAGTDTNPPEIVMFMRAVKSLTFFERIKSRGVRVIKPTPWRAIRDALWFAQAPGH